MAFQENTVKKYPAFQKSFARLSDPRRSNKGNFIYPLQEILFLTICSVLSGYNTWVGIRSFGNLKLEWLKQYMPFENGIPSEDVLAKVFALIDPDEFSSCFIDWINSLSELSEGQVISIDGKTIRSSANKGEGKKPFHVVSAYASVNGLTLGQLCVDQKSNEITAIPELLDMLSIEQCIVTIDAMGCQKQIAEKVRKKKADYILMVKDNHKTLRKAIKMAFDIQTPFSIDQQHDMGHGRIEHRRCQVITDLKALNGKDEWKDLKSIVKVSSERIDKTSGKTSSQDRYYISSLNEDASAFNKNIRQHWMIENKLHWSLDVIFKEDQLLKKKGNSALNFNVVSKMALSLLDLDKETKKSRPLKMQEAALSDRYRAKILKI